MSGTQAPPRGRQGQPGQQGKQQAQVAPRPFRVGVQSQEEIPYDQTATPGAGTVDLPVLNLPPNGFLRHMYLHVEGATAGNGAAVAFAEDGPFSVIDTLTFEDVNTAPIVGPITGWDLYLINKFGGYTSKGDAKASPRYMATTGGGTSGGSFRFTLRIPVELVPRDALGALPNKSGTAMYKLRIRLAGTAAIYSTAPTVPPTVRFRLQSVAWWEPDATDLKGRPLAANPPAVQTTQFWSKQQYPINPGSIRVPLQRVGALIRNLIFTVRDASNSRSGGETNFPDPFILQVETNILFTRLRETWKQQMHENWGLSAANEAADGMNNGVYAEPFNMDFGLRPGAETRRGYLVTSSAARLEVSGTLAGAGSHTLSVLTNDVVPANGDEAQLVA